MRFIITSNDMWCIGIYVINWGKPINNEWEVGIHFLKWSFGIELYK